MRYRMGHKPATRERIIKVASRLFRKAGADASSVADIMGAAKLTRGGFYSYFSSKEELFCEALACAMENTRQELQTAAETDGGGLGAILAQYLGPQYRDHSDVGCAVAALAAEIARHPDKTRTAFEREFQNTIATIGGHVRMIDPQERRRAAIVIFSIMTGALQLARAVADKSLSDQILTSAKDAILAYGHSGLNLQQRQ